MFATLPAPTSRSRWRAAGVLLAALMLSIVGLSQQQEVHAQAALPAPANLTPDGLAVDGVPVLSWDRVPGATTYTVELYGGTGMTRQWVVSTVNRRYVPVKHLPAGAISWRVKASAGTQTSDWAEASFDRDPLAGPTLVSPASGTVLDQPDEPVLLSWSPVRGATQYRIEVSTDSSFTDSTLTKVFSGSTTATIIPDMQVAQPYYWRVRAQLSNDLLTAWSEVRDYQVGGLDKAALVSPADSPTSDVEDIVLQWDPVPGARSYNLQVSTDQNFPPGNLDVDLSGNKSVMGTSYSPPVTLANDQYYWRVQPVDNSGNLLDWSQTDTWTFRRHWPDQPALEYPADNAIVGDPMFYQWTPVHLASSYAIQLATDPVFTNVVATCETVHTTYTPINKSDCYPADLGTYYWRVVAYDEPGKTRDRLPIRTDVVVAEVNRFTYVGPGVTLSSPVNGALGIQVPTLTWQPSPGAEKYKVTITRVDTGDTVGSNITTTGTSYTPREQLTAGKVYRWDVAAVSPSGRIGASLLAAAQPRFTMSDTPTTPTASTPEPIGPDPSGSHARFPTLSWTAVAGAASYKVRVRKQGNLGWDTLKASFYYPAGEDESAGLTVGSTPNTHLDAGTYEWVVDAYSEAGGLLSTSTASSTYTISPIPASTGLRASITGTASDAAGQFCEVSLPERCADLRQTPVLSWDPMPDESAYYVTIARDQEMTNILRGYPILVENTRFVPPDALVDSQAGSAFFWTIVPYKAVHSIGFFGHADRAFNKLSKPVQTISPAPEDTEANDITFSWRDYLETNQDASAFPPPRTRTRCPRGSRRCSTRSRSPPTRTSRPWPRTPRSSTRRPTPPSTTPTPRGRCTGGSGRSTAQATGWPGARR
ncbi:MAG: hypothetical protein R2731_16700 [Nocardioides sp.]